MGMCMKEDSSYFVLIIIEDDNEYEKIILCKAESFIEMEEPRRQLFIKKIFAESNLKKRNIFGFQKKIQYTILYNYNFYFGIYRNQIIQFVIGNQWDLFPFISFYVQRNNNNVDNIIISSCSFICPE